MKNNFNLQTSLMTYSAMNSFTRPCKQEGLALKQLNSVSKRLKKLCVPAVSIDGHEYFTLVTTARKISQLQKVYGTNIHSSM